jgi:predicted DNA-binding transcriptional regulator AlpA
MRRGRCKSKLAPPFAFSEGLSQALHPRRDEGVFVSTTDGRYLRPAEAAKLLGISVPTLYRWARTRPGFPQPQRLSKRVTVFIEVDLRKVVQQ